MRICPANFLSTHGGLPITVMLDEELLEENLRSLHGEVDKNYKIIIALTEYPLIN